MLHSFLLFFLSLNCDLEVWLIVICLCGICSVQHSAQCVVGLESKFVRRMKKGMNE